MKPKAYFTLPADYQTSTIESYATLNKELPYFPIREVYGSLPQAGHGGGRHPYVLPTCSDNDFRTYIASGQKANIAFNYTLNASCMGNEDLTSEGLKRLDTFISYLYDCGVRRFTVALPSLVDFLNRYYSDASIYLSIVYGLESIPQIQWLSEERHIDSVYIHEKLHRNVKKLKELTNFCHSCGIECAVLVNSFCDINCPYRTCHYNLVGHTTSQTELPFLWYYGTECNLRRLRDPRKALCMPWIRPDDMDLYTELGIDRFKYAGRDLLKFGADFNKAVTIYNDKKYEGNLFKLFMAFADCERADLYHIENTSALGEWLHKVFYEEVHCENCDNCGACSQLIPTVFSDLETYQKYKKMYEDRRNMGLNLLNH